MKLERNLVWALNDVWNIIGPDAFDALNESEMNQGEVIELVLDADRPITFHPEIDWTEFNKLAYAERTRICKEQVFTDLFYTY